MGGTDHMHTEMVGVKKGCIKSEKGPWVVHRTNKDGRVVTRHRFPSEQERLKNRERERKRRVVTRNIFSGLRVFGNYQLPKKPDTIDLLKALCEEAGWHVEEDGTIYKKKMVYVDGDYCENMETAESRIVSAKTIDRQEDHSINLKLSLTLAGAF